MELNPTIEPFHSASTPQLESAAANNCWNRVGLWGDRSCPELKKVSHCRNCQVYSAAGVQMLDRALSPGYLSEWTELLARPKPARVTGTRSVVVFRIGTEWLCLPASTFQEVAENRVYHRLPHRDNKIVLGLINIRGELLICVSLGSVLNVVPIQAQKRDGQHSIYERLLVVTREGSRFVFPVSEVYGIHRYHPSELKETPSTVSHASAKYSRGVFLWQEKTVGCLDDELVFYTLNRSLT
jgi:chemotaxis-related protein WspD